MNALGLSLSVKGYLLVHHLSLVLELKYVTNTSGTDIPSMYDRLTADTNSRVFVANGDYMSREEGECSVIIYINYILSRNKINECSSL